MSYIISTYVYRRLCSAFKRPLIWPVLGAHVILPRKTVPYNFLPINLLSIINLFISHTSFTFLRFVSPSNPTYKCLCLSSYRNKTTFSKGTLYYLRTIKMMT